MTKIELIQRVAALSDASEYLVREIVDNTIQAMTEALNNEEIITIRGFGSFRIANMKPKRCIDINSGEVILLPPRKKVSFTPGNHLKK